MKVTKKEKDLLTKIVASILFPMLLCSLIISLTGFRGPIQFDNTFYNFMQQAAIEASGWNIAIPEIPPVPYTDNVAGNLFFEIVDVLVDILNFLITIINAIVTIINFVLSLLVTIVAIIKLLLTLQDYDFGESTGTLSWWFSAYNTVLTI